MQEPVVSHSSHEPRPEGRFARLGRGVDDWILQEKLRYAMAAFCGKGVRSWPHRLRCWGHYIKTGESRW